MIISEDHANQLHDGLADLAERINLLADCIIKIDERIDHLQEQINQVHEA